MSCHCGCADNCIGPKTGMLMTGSYGMSGLGLGEMCDDGEGTLVDCSGLYPGYYPTESPYPVVFSPPPTTTPGYTPAATPPSKPSLLDQLAISWAGTAQQILKSNAGALPSFQTISPTGASTTVYGNPGNIPATLQTGLLSASGGSSLMIMGIAAVVLFAMMSKK